MQITGLKYVDFGKKTEPHY